ncbi:MULTISPECIES: ribbon-helix-helix protein, CopG family [Nostocaceae]|uniref:ribbon-helix-helix protein, CopG family n=1 Tax=Nostocaceae TaxID=1162 RepID=UPI001F549BC7|nr:MULTISPECIES: ribbon-helix-helix protein, CopG family [Nostocaceae]
MTDTSGKIYITLDLSPELNQTLEELAKKIGASKSDVVRQAITLMQNIVTEKQQIPSAVSASQNLENLSELDPWTKSLIGVISLESENQQESYVNYLEEKYS